MLTVPVLLRQTAHRVSSCLTAPSKPHHDHDSQLSARSVPARPPAAARQACGPARAAAAVRASRRQPATTQAAVGDKPY